MRFSVLYWNIWADNQKNGQENAGHLLKALNSIIKHKSPDIIGLNEVLRHRHSQTPFVIDFLEQHGFKHTFFVPSCPLDDNWMLGNAVCSKFPLLNTDILELGNDKGAADRGYPGYTTKAIAATLRIDQRQIGFVVAHPMFLSFRTIVNHYQQTSVLKKYMLSSKYPNETVFGVDFNEPRLMPASIRWTTRKKLNNKTGSILNPTWSLHAKHNTPFRANLDSLYWTKNSGLQLEKFKILKVSVSDHKPLYATFRINAKL